MQTGVIRLSPSGAPITNDEGGQSQPGPGFQLRLAETLSQLNVVGLPTGSQNVFQDPTPADIVVALANPDPNLRYKANCHLELENNTDGDSIVTLEIEASYDGQTNWNVISSVEHTIKGVGTTPAFGQSRLVAVDLPMTLGSALQTAMPANAPEIALRVTGGVNGGIVATNTGGADGNFFLSLAELL